MKVSITVHINFYSTAKKQGEKKKKALTVAVTYYGRIGKHFIELENMFKVYNKVFHL